MSDSHRAWPGVLIGHARNEPPALLLLDASADTEMVLQEVTARLQSRFGFAFCTVQVERHQEETAGCPHCQDPHA